MKSQTRCTIVAKLAAAFFLMAAFPAASMAQLQELELTSLCADNPASQLEWRIHNPNGESVDVTWHVLTSGEQGSLTVQPTSDTIFMTTFVPADPLDNGVVIEWDDGGSGGGDVAWGDNQYKTGACHTNVDPDTGACICLIGIQCRCEALGGVYQGHDTVCDTDGDGTDDCNDNCPDTYNPGQEDADNDGIGDACDGDRDGDGINNPADNCPDTYNPGQADADNDGIGDACDDDRDGDDVPNDDDNCPSTPNPSQADADGDGVGDACDDDTDGDGIPNGIDNCPGFPNADQADLDGDGTGDACQNPPTVAPVPQAAPDEPLRIPYLWQSMFGLPLCGPGYPLIISTGMIVGCVSLRRASRRRRSRAR